MSAEKSLWGKKWNCKVFVLVSQSLSASPLPSWFPPQIKTTVSNCRGINIGSSQVCFSSQAWWENTNQFSSFSKWVFRGLFTRLCISGELFPAALVERKKNSRVSHFQFLICCLNLLWLDSWKVRLFLFSCGFLAFFVCLGVFWVLFFFNSPKSYSHCSRLSF